MRKVISLRNYTTCITYVAVELMWLSLLMPSSLFHLTCTSGVLSQQTFYNLYRVDQTVVSHWTSQFMGIPFKGLKCAFIMATSCILDTQVTILWMTLNKWTSCLLNSVSREGMQPRLNKRYSVNLFSQVSGSSPPCPPQSSNWKLKNY